MSDLIVWPYDEAAARRFGEIFAELRRLGRPMQHVDVQIAAIALTLGNCTVVTKAKYRQRTVEVDFRPRTFGAADVKEVVRYRPDDRSLTMQFHSIAGEPLYQKVLLP